jgi:hypothetical protein
MTTTEQNKERRRWLAERSRAGVQHGAHIDSLPQLRRYRLMKLPYHFSILEWCGCAGIGGVGPSAEAENSHEQQPN